MGKWCLHFGQTFRFSSSSLSKTIVSHFGHFVQSPSGMSRFLVWICRCRAWAFWATSLCGRRRSQCPRLAASSAGSTVSRPPSDFLVKEVVSMLLNNIILKSARNCPDANIARAGGQKRLRARAGRRAGRENVVHQNHPLAVQTRAGADGKRAAHVRRALLPRQQGLGRRG